MLGVGLHSYGFMDSAVFWMLLFVASQLAIMSSASPRHLWRFVGLSREATLGWLGSDTLARSSAWSDGCDQDVF